MSFHNRGYNSRYNNRRDFLENFEDERPRRYGPRDVEEYYEGFNRHNRYGRHGDLEFERERERELELERERERGGHGHLSNTFRGSHRQRRQMLSRNPDEYDIVNDYLPELRTPLHNPFEMETDADGCAQVPPETTRREFRSLQKQFAKMDADGNQVITADELRDKLRNMDGTYFSRSVIELIFQIFDVDNSGYLDIAEFYYLLKSLKYWNQVFRRFDVNRSGSIDFNEFIEVLRYFGFRLHARTCAVIFYIFSDEHRSMKFDQFFEGFLLLTYFYNEYDGRGGIEEFEEYLLDRFQRRSYR